MTRRRATGSVARMNATRVCLGLPTRYGLVSRPCHSDRPKVSVFAANPKEETFGQSPWQSRATVPEKAAMALSGDRAAKARELPAKACAHS